MCPGAWPTQCRRSHQSTGRCDPAHARLRARARLCEAQRCRHDSNGEARCHQGRQSGRQPLRTPCACAAGPRLPSTPQTGARQAVLSGWAGAPTPRPRLLRCCHLYLCHSGCGCCCCGNAARCRPRAVHARRQTTRSRGRWAARPSHLPATCPVPGSRSVRSARSTAGGHVRQARAPASSNGAWRARARCAARGAERRCGRCT